MESLTRTQDLRAIRHRALEVGGRVARQEVATIARQIRRLRAYLARSDRGLVLEDHGLRNEGGAPWYLYRRLWVVRPALGGDLVEATLHVRAVRRGYLVTVEVAPRQHVGGRRADAVWRRIRRAIEDAAAERRRRLPMFFSQNYSVPKGVEEKTSEGEVLEHDFEEVV